MVKSFDTNFMNSLLMTKVSFQRDILYKDTPKDILYKIHALGAKSYGKLNFSSSLPFLSFLTLKKKLLKREKVLILNYMYTVSYKRMYIINYIPRKRI